MRGNTQMRRLKNYRSTYINKRDHNERAAYLRRLVLRG